MTIQEPPNGRDTNELALLDGVRAGDARALGGLLARHRRGMELFCYLMLGDRSRARTALTDTALAAADSLGANVPDTSARIWLYRLALRACSEADCGPPISFGVGDRLTG